MPHLVRLPLCCAALAAACLFPAPALAASSANRTAKVAGTVHTSTGYVGSTVRFRGTATPGTRILVERWSKHRGWVRTATTRASRRGTYLARWRATEAGRFPVRARRLSRSRSARAGAATGEVTVFRRVRATWYGPGLYGNRTACGQEMTPDLMGVAHRTLPCGTPVEIFHGGEAVTVPVVDRGPFANGAHYDLTAAVSRALGFAETGGIGVLIRRGQTMDPPPAPDAARVGEGGGTAAPNQP